MENEPTEKEIWDKLLESPKGMEAFEELMKEAQKEVDQDKTEEM